MGTHLIALYQNSPGGSNSGMSQAWQLCGFLTSPPLFYASLSRSPFFHLRCFLLITLISPRGVSPLSQSPTVTLSIILACFIRHQALFLLLSEVHETSRWLLYTMAPVFTLLFTCLQTALTTFSRAQRPPIHRGPFVPLYIVHTWVSE